MNRYIITLSKSDLLIIAWKRKALKAGQEAMGTLVKDAILSFIETGEFIDIGHIHFNPEKETVTKGDSIPLQTARTPIINQWINANVEAGLGISGPIKLLLHECIKVIPDDEAEYFPPPHKKRYNKASIFDKMRENAKKVKGSNYPLKETPVLRESKIPKESEVSQTVVYNKTTTDPSSIAPQKENSTPVNNNPQVINGLNGLLPKRASKSSTERLSR